MSFVLYKDGVASPVIVEENAINGLAFMAEKFCKDIEMVTDYRPEIMNEISEGEYAILVATCGNSEYLDKLEAEGSVDLSGIRGKTEVYGIFLCEEAGLGAKNTLAIICGRLCGGLILHWII